MPHVNPEILRWARETAGLSRGEASDKLGLREARGVNPVERLAALESGEAEPSRPMLVRMAKKYRRPLLTFYLSKPPQRGDRGQDFRTLPDEVSPADEAVLDALIRDLLARQSLIRSALEEEDEAHDLAFVGSATVDDGVQQVVGNIRTTLGLSLEEFRAARNPDEAFQLLRTRAEQAGVFILLVGNLGSYHTDIDLETFRGFTIADPVAPFIVLNDHDSRAAWSFTLLHELTHLWLGQTGVSGGEPDRAVERFCNEVAAEYLLPAAEVSELDLPEPFEVDGAAQFVGQLAVARNLSRSMVAYRLHRLGHIDAGSWRRLSQFFRDRWLEEQDRRRERGREAGGGPDYYVVRRHRLGTTLVEVTARLMFSGALTTSKAGKVLGVKPQNVGTLIGEYTTLGRAS
jgi:Zn-dependent peptidase ImmA (M78 family)/transcriptional regulator with XRE-family HTH domain